MAVRLSALRALPPGKFLLRKWEVSIKMDLIEIEWGGMDWIHMAQDRDKLRALRVL
jgi:hypothetical protein